MRRRISSKVAAIATACGLAIGSASAPAAGQQSPYVTESARDIKALSAAEIDELRAGAGMGLALAAELNGLPGPRHVLELADSLELDAGQRQRVATVFDRMQARARTVGAVIIGQERELDRAFAAHAITDAEVVERTGRIALLQGELRATHLLAHLETTALLRPEQVRRYGELRGYGVSDTGSNPAAHDTHH